jgi:hypothetical protein
MKNILILFLMITSSLSSQNIEGDYKLKNKNYEISFKEDGTFKRFFTVAWCGTGIVTEGTYALKGDTLFLNYEDIDFENPKIVDKKIYSSLLNDSIQVVRIKVFDMHTNTYIGFELKMEDQIEIHLLDDFLEIKTAPKNTTITILTFAGVLLENVEILKDYSYEIEIIVDSLSYSQDTYQVIRLAQNILVIKDQSSGKKLKLIKD